MNKGQPLVPVIRRKFISAAFVLIIKRSISSNTLFFFFWHKWFKFLTNCSTLFPLPPLTHFRRKWPQHVVNKTEKYVAGSTCRVIKATCYTVRHAGVCMLSPCASVCVTFFVCARTKTRREWIICVTISSSRGLEHGHQSSVWSIWFNIYLFLFGLKQPTTPFPK